MFRDRHEAGAKLADYLVNRADENSLILAIPRGGVIVGYEIAKRLKCKLDITVPRKVGAPGNEELAVGAVAADGTTLFDEQLVNYFGITKEELALQVEREKQEIKRRMSLYRGNRPELDLKSKSVIVVDDGVATGYTVMAALEGIRKKHPARLVLAVPVGPPDTIRRLKAFSDEVICLQCPERFFAVGQFYERFEQVTDEEVIKLLQEFWRDE